MLGNKLYIIFAKVLSGTSRQTTVIVNTGICIPYPHYHSKLCMSLKPYLQINWYAFCAQGLWAYISGKSQVPMLQLLCNTYKANSLNTNMSTSTWFFIHACLKGQIMVMQLEIYSLQTPEELLPLPLLLTSTKCKRNQSRVWYWALFKITRKDKSSQKCTIILCLLSQVTLSLLSLCL